MAAAPVFWIQYCELTQIPVFYKPALFVGPMAHGASGGIVCVYKRMKVTKNIDIPSQSFINLRGLYT